VKIILFLGVPMFLLRKEKEKPFWYAQVFKGSPEV
jgi:hypothetical protein